MPRSNVPRMADIQIRVMPALRLFGARKAVMPLEMASTPVRAVVPLANALQNQEQVTSPGGCAASQAAADSMTVPKVPVK